MTGSTEAIRVRGVGEAAKNVFQAEGPRSVLRDLHRQVGFLDSLLTPPVERDPEPSLQRRGAVIGNVNVDAVQALIRGPDRALGQGALQEPIRALGPAFRVENTPAC